MAACKSNHCPVRVRLLPLKSPSRLPARRADYYFARLLMPVQKIPVLLADDHTVVRQGFRVLLEAEPDLSVVGEAQTGRQAVDLAKKLEPDVVVMDVLMPVLNGLEATRQILRELPSTRVVILSSYNEDEYVNGL